MNTDAGLAGEAISAMNVYHTLAASTEVARLRGSATVSKDGVDSFATKVLVQRTNRIFYASARAAEALCFRVVRPVSAISYKPGDGISPNFD